MTFKQRVTLYQHILIKTIDRNLTHTCILSHLEQWCLWFIFSLTHCSVHEVVKDGTQLHLVVRNGTVDKDKINDLPLLQSLWALFLSLIHSLFMSGIVNLTSEQKGEGKDLGKVTTAFKFCGHWRIIILLSLRVNNTRGHKLYFIFSMIVESKTPFPLTHLCLARVCRGSNAHMCWPTSNKNSSNSQGVEKTAGLWPKNGWQVCLSWVGENLWLMQILKCN